MKGSRLNISSKTLELAIKLHQELTINNDEWHQLKGNHHRRAAELVSSGLLQLLSGGNSSDIEAQLKQGILWLKKEISDIGCPNKKE